MELSSRGDPAGGWRKNGTTVSNDKNCALIVCKKQGKKSPPLRVNYALKLLWQSLIMLVILICILVRIEYSSRLWMWIHQTNGSDGMIVSNRLVVA